MIDIEIWCHAVTPEIVQLRAALEVAYHTLSHVGLAVPVRAHFA